MKMGDDDRKVKALAAILFDMSDGSSDTALWLAIHAMTHIAYNVTGCKICAANQIEQRWASMRVALRDSVHVTH